jgi:hypothetical protein
MSRVRDFSYLWIPDGGLLHDEAWRGAYQARLDYLLLPIRIHEATERRSREKPKWAQLPEELPPGERISLERFYEAADKILPIHESYFERIGTIVYGFALLERACQMATVVLGRRRGDVVPWLERSGALTHKIEALLQRELNWEPPDGHPTRSNPTQRV